MKNLIRDNANLIKKFKQDNQDHTNTVINYEAFVKLISKEKEIYKKGYRKGFYQFIMI